MTRNGIFADLPHRDISVKGTKCESWFQSDLSWWEPPQALEYCIKRRIYTPYTSATDMMMYINEKFNMRKFKLSIWCHFILLGSFYNKNNFIIIHVLECTKNVLKLLLLFSNNISKYLSAQLISGGITRPLFSASVLACSTK